MWDNKKYTFWFKRKWLSVYVYVYLYVRVSVQYMNTKVRKYHNSKLEVS